VRGAERFRLPRTSSGGSPRWLAASLAAHAIVIVLWSWSNVPRLVRERERGAVIFLQPPSDTGREVPMRLTAPRRLPAAPAGPAAAGPVLGRPEVALAPDTSGLRVRAGGGPDSATVRGRGVPGGWTLADAIPQYGDGRLWVRPMWLPPDGGRPIRMDSVAAVRMLAMADSMERFPPANPNANPYVSRGWTFRRNGKTYGWDAAGIHFGDFTIPNAVLAFLSVPQGNIDQARANTALMEMRADIMRAAARAAAEEDFRQAVRDIRVRRDRERAVQRGRDSVRARLTP